jgi:hypothetical protein
VAAELLFGRQPVHIRRSLGTASGLPKLMGKNSNLHRINAVAVL